MSVAKDKIPGIITEFGESGKDTGSTEVQIAILTAKIKELTDHIKSNPKDFQSRRGLLAFVSSRNKLMRYFSRKKPDTYDKLCSKLGIKKK